MIEIILDGKKMNTKPLAHEYIKWKLKLPEYYGKNLDALWDLMSSYSDPIKICIINKENLICELGDYGESIIQLFKDAENENKNIRFLIKD